MNKPRNILVLTDHHQKEVKTLFVLLSMIFIMAYGFYRIILNNSFRFLSSGSVIAVYLLLCALWAGASIFLHFALYRKRLELHIIAACILPVFGLFYFLAFTPNTVPDELYHFASAYKVSNALLFVPQPLDPMSIPMRQSDISFLDTILPNSVNVDLYDFEKSYYIVQRSADLICKDNSIGLFYSQSSIENAPLCFFASGIGITIARMLNLGPVYLYYAGQLMNLMVTIASFCLAIRLTRSLRNHSLSWECSRLYCMKRLLILTTRLLSAPQCYSRLCCSRLFSARMNLRSRASFLCQSCQQSLPQAKSYIFLW